MSEGTYYEILGIDVNATEDDIRKAYRKQGTFLRIINHIFINSINSNFK